MNDLDRDAARLAAGKVIERATTAWSGRERDQRSLEHEVFLDRLARIARDAPQVRTAHALLDMHLIPPVPLAPDLTPVGEALTSVEDVLQHWTDHPGHGVGVTVGPHPSRPWTYVAVKVDSFGAWRDWLRDAAAFTVTVRDLGGFADLGDTAEVGPSTEQTEHRDTGAFGRLTWSPPPLSFGRWKMDATGGPYVKAMDERREGRGGWIWTAVHDPDRQLTIRKDRRIIDGITTVATGTVVPWDGTSNVDRWTVRLSFPTGSKGGLAPSRDDPIRPWLIEDLTGHTLKGAAA